MTRDNIIPLHTAKPFPWETFTLISPPPARIQRHRARVWRILLISAVLVMVGCGLAGLAGS